MIDNKLTSIDSIRSLINLENIQLSSNFISSEVEFLFENFFELKYLNLSKNRIGNLKFDKNPTNSTIAWLDLSQNLINGSVGWLADLKATFHVNISSNAIDEIENLTDSSYLLSIDVSFNKIERLKRFFTNSSLVKVVYIDTSLIDILVENI
jgi:Leucine-rich repeat (LRR) protein